ncbi:unnamed protein product, partial [Ixodes persulcatus]
WHVAVITFLILFVATVSLKNSGFILVGLMDEFDTDREHASWPTTIRVTFTLGAAILVGLLLRWFRARSVALAGSVCLWAGMIASAFPVNIVWVTVAFGIHGFGMGVMYVTTALALFKYFDKYKSFANGLARAGETAAGIVFPPVLVFLQKSYGFRGTLFIYGALALHATVLCVFLKEAPWTVKKQTLKTINKTDVFTTHSGNMANNQNEPPGSKSLHSSDFPDSVSHLLTMFRNPYFYLLELYTTEHHRDALFLRDGCVDNHFTADDVLRNASINLRCLWNLARVPADNGDCPSDRLRRCSTLRSLLRLLFPSQHSRNIGRPVGFW